MIGTTASLLLALTCIVLTLGLLVGPGADGRRRGAAVKQETVAIVGVGVALLVALASFLLPLRGDVRMLSGEVRALAERVAKIEVQNEMALRLARGRAVIRWMV